MYKWELSSYKLCRFKNAVACCYCCCCWLLSFFPFWLSDMCWWQAWTWIKFCRFVQIEQWGCTPHVKDVLTNTHAQTPNINIRTSHTHKHSKRINPRHNRRIKRNNKKAVNGWIQNVYAHWKILLYSTIMTRITTIHEAKQLPDSHILCDAYLYMMRTEI